MTKEDLLKIVETEGLQRAVGLVGRDLNTSDPKLNQLWAKFCDAQGDLALCLLSN